MSNEIAIVRFTVRERLETVVETLRGALEARGLRLAAQMDMAARVKRTLGITLPACSILFVLPRVWNPFAECAEGIRPTCLPMHLVIAEHGGQTWVQLQDSVSAQYRRTTLGEEEPSVQTQRQLIEAIETVATRPSVLA